MWRSTNLKPYVKGSKADGLCYKYYFQFPTASIALESLEGYIGCENKATSATQDPELYQ